MTASLQVLRTDGEALTTTRVAAVAGVSVGTLYQYFPNREALLAAVLAELVEAAVAPVVEVAARAGTLPAGELLEQAVRGFLAVKAERAEITRVLNRVFTIGKLDDRPLVRAAGVRAAEAVARILGAGRAPDAAMRTRAELACAALEGMVRTAIVHDVERLRDPAWIEQVVTFARAALPVQ
ncbi:MAG: TetR family transcriptional regulator [Kofleriaceae bacterium]